MSTRGCAHGSRRQMQPFETAWRFQFMSETSNFQSRPGPDPADDHQVEYVSTSDARQGQTGLGVRYVLAISLSAALALMAIIYFVYAAP